MVEPSKKDKRDFFINFGIDDCCTGKVTFCRRCYEILEDWHEDCGGYLGRGYQMRGHVCKEEQNKQ